MKVSCEATEPLSDRNSGFWTVACLLFGGCALAKGLRVPGSWAKSQLQITYIQGFVKRGFLGQALRSAHLRSAHAIYGFCAAEFVIFVALLVFFTYKSGLLSKRRNPALAAAFAGSYAITFLAHLIGYHDIMLYALALVIVLVRNQRTRTLVAIPVCILALLIHEMFLLTALPVILFSFFTERDQVRLRRPAIQAGIIFATCLITTLVLSLKPGLSADALQTFKQQTMANASYPFDNRVLDVVAMSMADNVRLNFHVIRSYLWWWAELGVAILTLGPLIALMVHSATSLASGIRRAAFLSASFAPLLMNVIGWDNVRWVTLCALTTFINLGLLTRSSGPPLVRLSRERECRAAILVMGLGLASGHGLMDAEKVNPYPFFPPAIRPAVIRHDGPLGQVL